jgi:hypothetical protein
MKEPVAEFKDRFADLPAGCMGIEPARCVGPRVQGCDIRPNSWDVAVMDVVAVRKGLYVPRLAFYGKVSDEAQALFVAKQYSVMAHVSDSAPDATLAERLQQALRRIGVKAWRASYLTAPSDVKITENTVERVLKLERTMVLDDVHYAFFGGLGIAIPQNYLEICGGAWKSELSSMTRTPTKWHGREYNDWVKHGDDHAFHTLSYAFVALEMSGLLTRPGGDATLGAVRGMVESTLGRNVVQDPGVEPNEDESTYLEATWEA